MSKRKIKNLPARKLKQTKRFTFRNKHDWLGFCNWVGQLRRPSKLGKTICPHCEKETIILHLSKPENQKKSEFLCSDCATQAYADTIVNITHTLDQIDDADYKLKKLEHQRS